MAADLIWLNVLQGVNTAVESINPVRLMAFDLAGNILARIRINDIRDHDWSLLSGDLLAQWLHMPDHGFISYGYDEVGNTQIAVGESAHENQVRDFFVTADGTLYCAMMGSGYSGSLFSGKINSTYSVDYVAAELGPSSPYPYPTEWRTRLAELTDPIPWGYISAHIPDRFFAVYRRNGDRVPFPDLHGAAILCVQLDSSGNIYVGGVPSGVNRYILRKYDSAGALQWSAAMPATTGVVTGFYGVRKFVLDSSNNIYAIGWDLSLPAQGNGNHYGSFLRKYNNSGAVQWTRRLFQSLGYATIYDVAVDDEGNVYTGSEPSKGYFTSSAPNYVDLIPWAGNNPYGVGDTGEFWSNLHKWDNDGNLLIDIKVPGDNGAITTVVFANSLIYINDALYNKSLVAQTWTLVDSYNSPGTHSIFDVDNSGNVFFSKIISPLPTRWYIAAIDASFTPLFATQDLTDEVGDMAVMKFWNDQSIWGGRRIAVVHNSALPALSLSIGLGIPSWIGDLYTAIPGLPMRFALGLVETIRDYVGPVRPIVYRLYLTGSPDIELKISSFSIRRSATAHSLSIVVPIESSAQMTAIEARAAGELLLKRGVKLGSGVEQLDEFMRVGFDGMRFDEGSKSFSASMDGKTEGTNSNPKTRTLTGISYRALQNGRRRVRCAVDTYIRPGDTANLGAGETMVVGELVYTVSAGSAIMECSEVAPT